MTLRELRKTAGLTAAAVAEKLVVAVSTLYHYEQGIRQIYLRQVLSLAELYDVTEREVIEAQIESVRERKKE